MTRDQLEHAIRSACEVANDTELYVFGSQAILGSYPDAVPELRASIEVDVQPKNRPEAVDMIDGNWGELSRFAGAHGFYVHGVSIESANIARRMAGKSTVLLERINRLPIPSERRQAMARWVVATSEELTS